MRNVELGSWTRACAFCALCALAATASPAQTVNTLVNFDQSNGSHPYYMALVQGLDGNLYGTTVNGGANDYGTVFKVTPAGTLSTLYSFCSQTNCADGYYPNSGLLLGTDGNFYGTTSYGGNNQCGEVFKISPGGAMTVLYSFSGPDGASPNGSLVQGPDGNFYGTTFSGGAYGGTNGYGTIFRLTPEGAFATVYSFDVTDGRNPNAGLVEGADGNFYGTTTEGGTNFSCGNGCGTVFKITLAGSLTTLHSFGITDGETPYAGVVQATDGSLYGTTELGGAYNQGTIFKIAPGGELTTLADFDSTNGAYPYAAPIQGTNGILYGTTGLGGANNYGTILSLTTAGILTTLHNFDSTDGDFILGGLVQDTNGEFYGATYEGGGSSGTSCGQGCGTIFSLDMGLGPFVKTLPTLGKVGQRVFILGTDLTGATSVTFNGTAATFKVVSPTLITTTVPTGATSGKVKVTTPSGTLLSNVVFRVR